MIEMLPPPGCQMLHLGALHVVVTHQCCIEPYIKNVNPCEMNGIINVILIVVNVFMVNLSLGQP